MTATEFREKLHPYFTPAQVGHLDAEAIQSAIDAHGKPADLDTLRTYHYMGRDFICDTIYNYCEIDPEYINQLAGSPIDEDARARLIIQFDIEL